MRDIAPSSRLDRLRAALGELRRADGAVLVEFALMLPVVLGLALTGIECCNYTIANNKVQRLAAMTADLVAQSGSGVVGASEPQIYDLFSAIDLSAKPFNLREHGRVIITAVRGTDNDKNNVVENRILWQRFDGGFTAAPIRLGCHKSTTFATLPNNRTMLLDEMLLHVQVSYEYEPIFARSFLIWMNLPTSFDRVAVYRVRNDDFAAPTPVAAFPPKQNCTTADGL